MKPISHLASRMSRQMVMMPRSACIVATIAALAACLVDTRAYGSTSVTLAPSKDTTLFEDTPSRPDFSNGQGVFLFAGKTGAFDGMHLRRGLIAFDLAAAIPPQAVISSVTFTMVVTRANPDAGATTISLYAVNADWGEGASDSGDPGGTGAPAQDGDATWRYRVYPTTTWNSPGGDFRAVPSATAALSADYGAYSWIGGSLVGDVQAWVSNPSSNFGWLIRGDESMAAGVRRFDTRENDFEPPQLTVVYQVIPEPDPAALLAIAAMLAFVAQRPEPRIVSVR
jgi:hypothetical protein